MADNGKNFSVYNLGSFKELADKEIDGAKGRVMLGHLLGLTGCEISINSRKAGEAVPFVHHHKMNEEVYMILSGSGIFHIDGEEFPVGEGDMIRVAPAGMRSIKAVEPLVYACIQAHDGSLAQATMLDGVITKDKTSWM